MRYQRGRLFASACLIALILTAGCEQSATQDLVGVETTGTTPLETHFQGPVPELDAFPIFDLATAPDGSILYTAGQSVMQLRKGEASSVIEVDGIGDSPLNGLATTGRRSFFTAVGGLDLAANAAVLHVSGGTTRSIGDIEAFETAYDPDANAGPQWKNVACEASDQFSAGPQSNPYHLTAFSGSEVAVADAAGNTLLYVRKNGDVDWLAVFTPPTADGSGSLDPADWVALFPLSEEVTCYVQPVPTAVAIGPDGDYYVGELTGFSLTDLPPSRIWRIDGDARNVTCPSDACEVFAGEFTSIIDLAFGPDGYLYVAELDANGWFEATENGNGEGGVLSRCDAVDGSCTPVATFDATLGAIDFDKRGELWAVQNDFTTFSASIGQVDY